MQLIKEFWPAIKFLLTFLATYFIGNVLYGVYIESTKPAPDLFTKVTAAQAAWAIKQTGQPITVVENTNEPTVFFLRGNQPMLSVYEGCNGINVMVVFVSFMVAFAGPLKRKLIFFASGIFVINAANVVRVALLYFVAIDYQSYFYFLHKYVFTILLYAIVVILWLVYINGLNDKQESKQPAH